MEFMELNDLEIIKLNGLRIDQKLSIMFEVRSYYFSSKDIKFAKYCLVN
jgi:hypothetical protein